MSVYYNENDAYCADRLESLIKKGLIADGRVDRRSIVDVRGADLDGYSQCHFFAGIGGWSYALRLAGWPDDRPVWTGSCPCQPLSGAGQRKGHVDERHLWPAFYRLIAECRPATVFGEQVAGADGREWLAGVRADLEALGYAVGAADLCAAGVGAPHIRQRLFWVADAGGERRQQVGRGAPRDEGADGRRPEGDHVAAGGGATGGVGIPDREGRPAGELAAASVGHGSAAVAAGDLGGLGDADDTGSQGRRLDAGEHPDQRAAGAAGEPRGLGNPEGERWREDVWHEHSSSGSRESTGYADGPSQCEFWSDFALLPCTDGKSRRTQPGLQPLAHGIPARVGRLRAYGNAIVPQVAAEFVKAAMEVQ